MQWANVQCQHPATLHRSQVQWTVTVTSPLLLHLPRHDHTQQCCANNWNFGSNRTVSYLLFNLIWNQSNNSKFSNTYLNTIYTRKGLHLGKKMWLFAALLLTMVLTLLEVFTLCLKNAPTLKLCNQPSRSTQPSTLCGTVKWVSAFGLSNDNKWRWWTRFTGCL